MKKFFVGGIVVLAVLTVGIFEAQAQMGVGVKVPPLVLPNVFVAFPLSENQLAELTGSIQLNQFVSAIMVGANLKQYFRDLFNNEAVPLTPFFGAGGTLTFASVSGVGSGASAMAIGAHGILGVEYGIPDTRLHAFLEFIPGIIITPVFGFGIGGAVGVRLDF